MVPFCRTPEEGRKVLELMEKFGLEKGRDGLKVICMCEIPSNVILAEEFLDIFDGVSLGTNDLLQTTLGIDRDNAYISKIADETNEAIKRSVAKVIKLANEKGKYNGICGDAPSTILEFAQFLIDCKIKSMSLSPDAVIKTILLLAKKRLK
jgi:pyruvate,water dikinase